MKELTIKDMDGDSLSVEMDGINSELLWIMVEEGSDSINLLFPPEETEKLRTFLNKRVWNKDRVK